MIKIETKNETEEGFDCDIHIEGEANICINELISIFDHIYHASPTLFQTALLHSEYCKKVTGE